MVQQQLPSNANAACGRPTTPPPSSLPHEQQQGPSSEQLSVIFRKYSDLELKFQITKTMPLGKAMHAYSGRLGMQVNNLRFLFEGQRVNDYHTAASLEMEDGDVVEVHVEQIGGNGDDESDDGWVILSHGLDPDTHHAPKKESEAPRALISQCEGSTSAQTGDHAIPSPKYSILLTNGKCFLALKVSNATPMYMVFEVFASKIGKSWKRLVFQKDGNVLDARGTAGSSGLVERDVIKVNDIS